MQHSQKSEFVNNLCTDNTQSGDDDSWVQLGDIVPGVLGKITEAYVKANAKKNGGKK